MPKTFLSSDNGDEPKINGAIQPNKTLKYTLK